MRSIEREPQLPDFLVIGAMKAGTTTLYEDLNRVDGIYLPPEKEPNDLAYPEVETPEGLARYAAKFADASAGQLRGEASTAYSKRPTHNGVAERALRVLGPELKIIYMTRDPIERIRSHYHHLFGLHMEARPLDQAVLEDPTYVAYSCYEWQLAPWRALLPTDAIHVVSLEDYLADRQAALCAILAFLGVEASVEAASSHRNASAGKRIVPRGGGWSRLAHSRFYLYRIKPLLPSALRDRVKAAVLPRARAMTEEMSDGTRTELRRRLRLHETEGDVLSSTSSIKN